jgi:hypothetical protein
MQAESHAAPMGHSRSSHAPPRSAIVLTPCCSTSAQLLYHFRSQGVETVRKLQLEMLLDLPFYRDLRARAVAGPVRSEDDEHHAG